MIAPCYFICADKEQIAIFQVWFHLVGKKTFFSLVAEPDIEPVPTRLLPQTDAVYSNSCKLHGGRGIRIS
jgi:hypothetical protein